MILLWIAALVVILDRARALLQSERPRAAQAMGAIACRTGMLPEGFKNHRLSSGLANVGCPTISAAPIRQQRAWPQRLSSRGQAGCPRTPCRRSAAAPLDFPGQVAVSRQIDARAEQRSDRVTDPALLPPDGEEARAPFWGLGVPLRRLLAQAPQRQAVCAGMTREEISAVLLLTVVWDGDGSGAMAAICQADRPDDVFGPAHCAGARVGSG